jgi:alkylation response protein AidB-like acyl-CoA dehydrogenase
MGLKFVAEAVKVEHKAKAGQDFQPPTVVASEYKLFATELSRRLASAAMDIGGAGTQLRVHTEDAPMVGRSESTYRYTVIDTIGGGSSEIQKNIIAEQKAAAERRVEEAVTWAHATLRSHATAAPARRH